jgi:isoleucyl-tRNA synthetase
LKLVDGQNIIIGSDVHLKTDNVMDKWIISAFQSLVKLVREEMERYRLDTVMPHLLKFIDQLSRWFVRFNKTRMKGDSGALAAAQSLGVLFEVLLGLCKLMAPFTPFFVEYMYQNLVKLLPESERKESVHYCMIPKPNMDAVDEKVEQSVSGLQSVIDLGRSAREKSNQPSFRFPYPELIIVHQSEEFLQNMKTLESYMIDELNVKKVGFSSEVSAFISLNLVVDNKSLGTKLRKKKAAFEAALKTLTQSDLSKLQAEGKLAVKYHNGESDDEETIVVGEDVTIEYNFSGDSNVYEANSNGGLVVLVNKQLDDSCLREGYARELVSRVQLARKDAKLTIEDSVNLYIGFPESGGKCLDAYESMRDYIFSKLRQPLDPIPSSFDGIQVISDTLGKARDEELRVIIARK